MNKTVNEHPYKVSVERAESSRGIPERGWVDMDVRWLVTKDSVGQIFQGVPSVNTRQVGTQVLVSNGETVVLGGIYEQTRTDNVTKVPFLGDIPLLGALFRNSDKVDSKSELLIFVTPKVLKESLTMR